jgi:hypothetical protein
MGPEDAENEVMKNEVRWKERRNPVDYGAEKRPRGNISTVKAFGNR